MSKHQAGGIARVRGACASIVRAFLLVAAISSALPDQYHRHHHHYIAAMPIEQQQQHSQKIASNDLTVWESRHAAEMVTADPESNAIISAPRMLDNDNYSMPKTALINNKMHSSGPQKTKKAKTIRYMPIASPQASSSPHNTENDQASAAQHQQHQIDGANAVATTAATDATKSHDCMAIVLQLRDRFVEQVIRQRIADKDHLLMEKWLVDNINDLHRELKQTEVDFEHYVQVTKRIFLEQGEHNNLRRHLAKQTSLTLSVPLQNSLPFVGESGPLGLGASRSGSSSSSSSSHSSSSSSSGGVIDGAAYRQNQYHLTKMLLLHQGGDHRAS